MEIFEVAVVRYGLLDAKLGFVSQVSHQNEIWKKNISSAISSQQISGKNSESE